MKSNCKKSYERKLGLKEFLIYFLVPLTPLIIFWFLPMITSILISFTNWNYVSPNFDVVGIDNYKGILQDEFFWQAFKNTIIFGVGTVVPVLFFGFIFALLLQGNIKGKVIYQGFLFSPWVTPMVAMSIVWSWMLRGDVGLINRILEIFGINGPEWLSNEKTAMFAVIMVTIWKNAGWAMLFYTDAMSKIPKSLFEVGEVEGINTFEKIKYIYFPMTKRTTFFLLIMNLITSIQAYDQFSVLTRGGPAGSTRTLLYLFYQKAFEEFNMGSASAISLIIVIITAILSLFMIHMKKRLDAWWRKYLDILF
mgnify:CR=1 FL=1